MKNEFTSKINTLGRCGRIVSNIMKGISLACAIVLLVCTLIVCIFVPSDSLKFNGTAQAVLSYDTEQRAIGFENLENKFKKFMGAEVNVTFEEKADPTGNGFNNIDIIASAEGFTGKQMKALVCVAGFGATLFLASMYVIFVFAVKLCKALEVCKSPFEENVITAIKKLGFSFIPFGVISIILNGISILSTVMIVLVILLFVYIFSYGAELQRESDDTV